MKYIFIFISVITFFACSEENYLDTDYDNETSRVNNTLKYSGDGKYDALGYGYDVTEAYFEPSGVRGAVIDNEKIEKQNSKLISTQLLGTGVGTARSGFTAEDYTRTLNAIAEIKWNFAGVAPKAFEGSVKKTYNSVEHYNTKYSFVEYNHEIALKSISYLLTTDNLSNYTTAEFQKFVETSTPEQIIDKYGTNVLTNVKLGAKLRVLYKCHVKHTSSDIKKIIENNASLGVSKVFTIDVDVTDHTIKEGDVTEEAINYKTIGGNPSLGLTGELSLENLDSNKFKKIDITNWLASCDTTRGRMFLIDVKPSSAIPIWEFVKNQTKKESLKNAILNYLKSKEFKDIYKGKPIFLHKSSLNPNMTSTQYCYTWLHNYVLSFDRIFNNPYVTNQPIVFNSINLGALGQILESKTATTIPLYKYTIIEKDLQIKARLKYPNVDIYGSASHKFDEYTTDFSKYGYGYSNITYEGIVGYVFATNIDVNKNNSSLIPIYNYTLKNTDKSNTTAHYTRNTISVLNPIADSGIKENYVRGNIAFYLLPIVAP